MRVLERRGDPTEAEAKSTFIMALAPRGINALKEVMSIPNYSLRNLVSLTASLVLLQRHFYHSTHTVASNPSKARWGFLYSWAAWSGSLCRLLDGL